MPNINRSRSASGELRRLTMRLAAALARSRRTRERRRGCRAGSGRSGARAAAAPAPRAARTAAPAAARAVARGGARIQSGVTVGPVGRQVLRIVNHYPRAGSLTITSGYRPGGRDHHGGLVYGNSPTAALDIWASSAAGMRDIAKWLYDRFAGDTVELIHTTPFSTDRGFYVKNQRKYPGGGVYGPQTRREHRNHVHFATSKALAAKILARLEAKRPAAPPARPAQAAVRTTAAVPAGRRRLSKRGAAAHRGVRRGESSASTTTPQATARSGLDIWSTAVVATATNRRSSSEASPAIGRINCFSPTRGEWRTR